MRINFVIPLLIIVVGNSCQKKYDAPMDLVADSNIEFTANISGVQFIAALSGAVRRSDGIISIAGKSRDGKILAFTIVDSGVHVYSLDMYSSVNFCGYEDNNGLAFSSNEGINPGDSGGTLIIAQIDTVKSTMSGTFSLKVFRQLGRIQRVITDGVFKNVAY